MNQREIKCDDNVYEILDSVNELLKEEHLKIIFDDGEEHDGFGMISLEKINEKSDTLILPFTVRLY